MFFFWIILDKDIILLILEVEALLIAEADHPNHTIEMKEEVITSIGIQNQVHDQGQNLGQNLLNQDRIPSIRNPNQS